MPIYTGEVETRPMQGISTLLAQCGAENFGILSGTTKIVAISAFLVLVLLLLEITIFSKRGWVGRVVHLWLTAKERELREDAQCFEKRAVVTSTPFHFYSAKAFFSFFFAITILLLAIPWLLLFLAQLNEPRVIFETLGIFATCTLDLRSIAIGVKVASICTVALAGLRFVALLLSPKGARVSLLFKLWREAKEHRLRDWAGDGS